MHGRHCAILPALEGSGADDRAMWQDLTHLDISVLDKAIRTVAVYLAMALLLRLAGKRDLAQLNSFDLVVMLLFSNVVQNAVIGPDNSLLGGLLGAAILIAVNAFVVRTVGSRPTLETLAQGKASVLARDGHWDRDQLRKEGIREADLDAVLRRQNAYKVDDVQEVRLEPGGTFVVTLRPELESATREDIARIEAKLDRLLGVE
jgi:uncharacterized membrane protein YcaP (DUF421 family)